MEVLCVLSRVSLGKGINLDPEGDALLPTVLPGSELCADAVHLKMSARGRWESRNTSLDGRQAEKGKVSGAKSCEVSTIVSVHRQGQHEPQPGAQRALVLDTCTKTEVLFFMSHRNSAALSWEGWVFGSTMPTDMGISAPHKHTLLHSQYKQTRKGTFQIWLNQREGFINQAAGIWVFLPSQFVYLENHAENVSLSIEHQYHNEEFVNC